ncbi:MAG TPA: heme o synthase [Thermoanaerobaculia bacterium]|nr:heme o synthase [Thermoanaerobaculia bacterium]
MKGTSERPAWAEARPSEGAQVSSPLNKAADLSAEVPALARPSSPLALWRDYFELSKARIVFMVLLTTLAGLLMASSGGIDAILLAHTLLGTALVAGGTNALNQYVERDLDRRMNRTRMRPLPDGRITPAAALIFSVTISVIGTLWLALLVNLLAAFLALFTLVTYLFIYTPLKLKTSLSTLAGAVPGAIPPMIGWAAVSGRLDAGAWILFAILLFWQMPHFLAIGWLYREDYARAGFEILSVGDRDGRASGRQAMLYTVGLVVVSILPAFFGIAGAGYLTAALLTGVAFLIASALFASARTLRAARTLFVTSIIYLPLIMSLLVAGVPR